MIYKDELLHVPVPRTFTCRKFNATCPLGNQIETKIANERDPAGQNEANSFKNSNLFRRQIGFDLLSHSKIKESKSREINNCLLGKVHFKTVLINTDNCTSPNTIFDGNFPPYNLGYQ